MESLSHHVIGYLENVDLVAKVIAALTAAALLTWKKLAKHTSAWLVKYFYEKYKKLTSFEYSEVSAALRSYVPHEYMKVDPSTKMDLADALTVKRNDLFKGLDDFFSEKERQKFLFIFADCRMGKATFLINYFHKRTVRFKKRGLKLALISLSKVGYDIEINSIPVQDRASTVLLMDAFDEDPLVLEGVEKRLKFLIQMTASFNAVVITCRSQFFASDSEVPVATGTLRTGATPAGMSKEYEFRRFYLAPFGEKNQKYLNKSMPGVFAAAKRRRARSLIERVPSLVMRPMLLAHISDVLEIESRDTFLSQAEIYQAIVLAWAKREEHWLKPRELIDFSKHLSLDIYIDRSRRGGEICERSEVTRLAVERGIDIRPELLSGRSLLNRMGDGRCKFAHRSIMEYFVAEALVDGSASSGVDLTDQIAIFSLDFPRIPQNALLGRLAKGSKVEVISAEKRLGYSTNFNLLHESRDVIDARIVYGASVTDQMGKVCKLGEHLQDMLNMFDELKGFKDIRIAISGDINESGAMAFVSAWGHKEAVLSVLNLDGRVVKYLSSPEWSARKIYNIVGRFIKNGATAAELEFRSATFCNGNVDLLGIDSAEASNVISAEFEDAKDVVSLKLIPGFRELGASSAFGILKGGSRALVDGKRFAKLKSRSWAQEDAFPASKEIFHETALIAPAERWVTDRVRNIRDKQ